MKNSNKTISCIKKWLFIFSSSFFLIIITILFHNIFSVVPNEYKVNEYSRVFSSKFNKLLNQQSSKANNTSGTNTISTTSNIYSSHVVTNQSLKNLGIIKEIGMRKLHALSTSTRVSEIHFIDIYGNRVPWTINRTNSSLPIISFQGNSYQSKPAINPILGYGIHSSADTIGRTYSWIENKLQDNRYVPYISNNSFKTSNANLFDELEKSIGITDRQRTRQNINDRYTSVKFVHNNKVLEKNQDTLGGVDLSFSLNSPSIIDRIEIWMAPDDAQIETAHKDGKTITIRNFDADENIGAFGIEELSVLTIDNRNLYTIVADKKYLANNNNVTNLSENAAMPFAINESYGKNNDGTPIKKNRSWVESTLVGTQRSIIDKNSGKTSTKKINEGSSLYPITSYAGDSRAALFVGGKNDKYKRTWHEKNNKWKDQTQAISPLAHSNTYNIQTSRINDFISVDSPEGYISLLVNDDSSYWDKQNKRLKSMPNNHKKSEGVGWGSIDVKDKDVIHLIYIPASYRNQGINATLFDKSFPSPRKKTFDSDLINVTYSSSKKSSTTIEWDLKKLDKNILTSFKNKTNTYTRLSWNLIDMPKLSGSDSIFEIFYRYKMNDPKSANLRSEWYKANLVLGYNDINNLNIGSEIEIAYVLKPNIIIGKERNQNIFKKKFTVDRYSSIHFPVAGFKDNLVFSKDRIKTNGSLESLGLITEIDLSMLMLEDNAFTKLLIIDNNNALIPYNIKELQIYNDVGEKITLDENICKAIADTLQDNNFTLSKFKNASFIDQNKTNDSIYKIKGSSNDFEFGWFSKKHKIKLKIELNHDSRISYIKFVGGTSSKIKKPSIDYIRFKNNNSQIYQKKYKNYFDSIINNFTNYNGDPSMIYSPKKIDIDGRHQVFVDSFEMYFGKQSIDWFLFASMNQQNKKMIELGEITEGDVYFLGSKDEFNAAIKNLIFYDENGNEITYFIDMSHFLSGFDFNSTGSLPNQGDQNFINQKALPKKHIVSVNDDEYNQMDKIYSGAIDGYVHLIKNGSINTEIPILQNVYRDPNDTKSHIFKYNMLRYPSQSDALKTDLVSILNYIDSGNLTFINNFDAVLSRNTKDNDVVMTTSLLTSKARGKNKTTFQFVWKENPNHKNLFSLIVRVTHKNGGGEDDGVFMFEPTFYKVDWWVKMKASVYKLFPNVNDSWNSSPTLDVNIKYEFDKLSAYLSQLGSANISTYNETLLQFTKHTKDPRLLKNKELGYFKSNSGTVRVKLFNEDSPFQMEENIVSNIEMDPQKTKKISFDIAEWPKNVYSYGSGSSKTDYDKLIKRLKDGYISLDLVWTYDSLENQGTIDATLSSNTKDGDIIFKKNYNSFDSAKELTFYWSKEFDNIWSIKVRGKNTSFGKNTHALQFWFHNIKIDDTPLIFYPYLGISGTKYDNKMIETEKTQTKDYLGQVPIMKVHFKFKNPTKIAKIQVVSKGDDENYDIEENYKGWGGRKIRTVFYGKDGKIFESGYMTSTKKDGTTYADKNEFDQIGKDNLGWRKNFYGINSVMWSIKEISHGDNIFIKYQDFDDVNIKYKIEVSYDQGKTWIDNFEVKSSGKFLVRISKFSKFIKEKYAILGFNYAGNVPVLNVLRDLKQEIKNQQSNLNTIINNFIILPKKVRDRDFSLAYNLMLQMQGKNNYSFKDLIDWLGTIKSPQLLTEANIQNLFKQIVLDETKVKFGTGATGDGSGNTYRPTLVRFANGNDHIIFPVEIGHLRDRSMQFDFPIVSKASDVRIYGLNRNGKIKISDYITNSEYQDIKIIVNKGKFGEKRYINENARDIKNGDMIEVIITPKSNVKFYVKNISINGDISYILAPNFKVSFKVSHLKGKQVLSFDRLVFLNNIKSKIKISGSETNATISGVSNLAPQNTKLFVEVLSGIGKKRYYLPLNNLEIKNGDRIEFGIKSNEGFEFSFGAYSEITKIYYKTISNLQKVTRQPKPLLPQQTPLNFEFFDYRNKKLKIIPISDQLFITIKNTIDLQKFNLQIDIFPNESIIPYISYTNLDKFANHAFSSGDRIKISIFPKIGIFNDGSRSWELEYVATKPKISESGWGKKLKASIPYSESDIVITGVNKQGKLWFDKNKKLIELVRKGYKLVFYVYREVDNKNSNASIMNSYYKNPNASIINSYYKQLTSASAETVTWKLESWPRKYILKYELNMSNIGDDGINFNFKNKDKILIAFIPDYSRNFYWVNKNWNSTNLVPVVGEVKNLKELVTSDLPKVSDEIVGFNGKNEFRENDVYKDGKAIKNIVDYHKMNSDVDVKIFIVRQNNVNKSIKSYDDKEKNGLPLENQLSIIDGFEVEKNTNGNDFQENSIPIMIDPLLDSMPSLYNGDEIFILYTSKDPNKLFYNGSSKIINSFSFHTDYVAVLKPETPKDASRLFNGLNKSGTLDFSQLIFDESNNNINIKWDKKNAQGKSVTITYHSVDEAKKAINGNLSNGDKVSFKIWPKEKKWWGLIVSGIKSSNFLIEKSYSVTNLPNKLIPLDPFTQKIFYETDPKNSTKYIFIDGQSQNASLYLKEFLERNDLLKLLPTTENLRSTNQKYLISIIFKDNKGKVIKIIPLDTVKDIENLYDSNINGKFHLKTKPFKQLKDDFKILLRFKPVKGYQFTDSSTYSDTNAFLIPNFPKNVYSKLYKSELSKVIWIGYQQHMIARLPKINQDFGTLVLISKDKNKPSAQWEEVRQVPSSQDLNKVKIGSLTLASILAYDSFYADKTKKEYKIKFIPNHKKNYWINRAKNINSPNDDFDLIDINVPNNQIKLIEDPGSNEIITKGEFETKFKSILKDTPSAIVISGDSKNGTTIKLHKDLVNYAEDHNMALSMKAFVFNIKTGKKYGYDFKLKNNGDYYTDIFNIQGFKIIPQSITIKLDFKNGYTLFDESKSYFNNNLGKYKEFYNRANKNTYIYFILNNNSFKIDATNWKNNFDFQSISLPSFSNRPINTNSDKKEVTFTLQSNEKIDVDIISEYFNIKLEKKVSSDSWNDISFKADGSPSVKILGIKNENHQITIIFNIYYKDPTLSSSDEFRITLLPKLKSTNNQARSGKHNNFPEISSLIQPEASITLDNYPASNIIFGKIKFPKLYTKINHIKGINVLSIDPKNNIPGLAKLDYRAMGIDNPFPKYDVKIIYTKRGQKNTISFIDFDKVPLLDIRDKIKIVFVPKNANQKFEKAPNMPISEYVFLDSYTIKVNDLRKIVFIKPLTSTDIQLSGLNHDAIIKNIIDFYKLGVKLSFSINGSQSSSSKPHSLSNGDVIVFRYEANPSYQILSNGHYTKTLDERVTISGLLDLLDISEIHKRAFSFVSNNNGDVELRIIWSMIINGKTKAEQSKIQRNSRIAIKIRRANSNMWNTFVQNGKTSFSLFDFISNNYASKIILNANDEISITITANKGYAFKKQKSQINKKIVVDNITKLPIVISAPKLLSYDDNYDTNDHAKLALKDFDIPKWKKFNLKFKFIVAKQNGTKIIYGLGSKDGELPVNLSNGDKITLVIENKAPYNLTQILLDKYDGSNKTDRISRSYIVKSLDASVLLKDIKINSSFKGFNGKAIIISPSSSPKISFLFSLLKKGSSTWSSYNYYPPNALSNGDQIKLKIKANAHYKLVDQNFRNIKGAYNYPHILKVEKLYSLLKTNLPEYIRLVYDPINNQFEIKNIDLDEIDLRKKLLSIKVNGKLLPYDKLFIGENDLKGKNNFIIEISVKSGHSNWKLNEDLETLLNKKYQLPNSLNAFTFDGSLKKDVVYENEDGSFSINSHILSNFSLVDFLVYDDKSKEWVDKKDISTFSRDLNIKLKIIPKSPFTSFVLSKDQDYIVELVNNSDRTDITIDLPKSIEFEGFNKQATLKKDKLIDELLKSDIIILYKVIRDGKATLTENKPMDLRNGDKVQIIAKGGASLYIKNNNNNKASTKIFTVEGLINEGISSKKWKNIIIYSSAGSLLLAAALIYFKLSRGGFKWKKEKLK